MSTSIEVSTTVAAPVERAWAVFTEPDEICGWNYASPEWHCPEATNDLRVGGHFSYTMASRDGQTSFEFGGTYTRVDEHRAIEYRLSDGREVRVTFEPVGEGTRVTETFDAEDAHAAEQQRAGWQAILDNYRARVEA